MSFRDSLKWIASLFCVITTFQIILAGVLFRIPFHQATRISPQEILMYLSISVASALPVLILVNVKPLSLIPLWLRKGIHFISTFSAVFFLLFHYGIIYNPILFSLLGAYLFVFFLSAALYFIAFSLYEKEKLKKEKARRREQEEKFLQYYTEEVERQYRFTRKFQHDYRNILLSIKGFLDDEDFAGLKSYYSDKVETASVSILNNHFLLGNLDKIKVREIKSILVAKLMLAQNDTVNTTFEANEDIDDFPVDSVALVRMLGIVLDNAIEAVEQIGYGSLYIGCFKSNDSICFIVRNACPSDMPPLYRLWEQGFSTKGKNRGLGLSNLLEIISSLPNVTLETEVEEGHFTHKIILVEKHSLSRKGDNKKS